MSDSLYELQSDIQRLALQQTQIQASHSQPGPTEKYSSIKGLSHELLDIFSLYCDKPEDRN